MRGYRFIFRLLALGVLLSAICYVAMNPGFLEPALLERELRRCGQWAPMGFVLIYAVATMLFVPGSILTIAGGALFGPLWGTL